MRCRTAIFHCPDQQPRSFNRSSQLSFADAKSLPKVVRIMHSHAVTGPFRRIGGDVVFSRHGADQLEHVFDLGAASRVLNYLQLMFVGFACKANSGACHGERMLQLAAPAVGSGSRAGWHAAFA